MRSSDMIDEIIVSQNIRLSLMDVLSVFEAISNAEPRWAGAVTIQQDRSMRAAIALGFMERFINTEGPEWLQYRMVVRRCDYGQAAREVLDYIKVQDIIEL